MAQKYKIWTDGKIYINEKVINVNATLSSPIILSPKSEINISNVQFYIDFEAFKDYQKYKVIPKIQFIKNGQYSNWMSLIDASENILPVKGFFLNEDKQYFAKWVRVDADTSDAFQLDRRKNYIDYGTAYNHDDITIDYPGALHFTPEFGSQEIPNVSNPNNYKVVKRILTRSASKDHTKYRLSGNAMNWITYAEKAASNDIDYKQKDFIDFRIKFGIYKFNKSTQEYNDESNEVYSTDYKEKYTTDKKGNSIPVDDYHLLKDTVFRVYLSPDIINNESLSYVKNIFGKNLTGQSIYDYNDNYYRGSFVWNTAKNPLSGRIKFYDDTETYRLLIDYTHYDGTDYSGYYPGPSTGASFNRKVLNKYRFKILSDTDMRNLEDNDYRKFANEYRYTSPQYVYGNYLPGTINLSDYKNRDLLVTSAVGYEVLEFGTTGRVGPSYYYPYTAADWPDDDSYPYGYYNTKSKEQKIYHYISPSVSGKVEFYVKSGDTNKELTKKDNKECIAYNSTIGFKFKRNVGRWNNSLNDGDKYIVQLKFTYRLEGEKSDTTFTRNITDKIFKGSTNIYVGDAEKATEETVFDLPRFSSLFPNVFGQQDYIDVKIEGYYIHCYGEPSYGYSHKISNYTTESAKIFTTKIRVYQHLAITEQTPEYVFYNSDNNLCESVFESSENMIVDFNTFNKLNCVKIKNINSVLASYVPNHNITEIAFNTLITTDSDSSQWINFSRMGSLPDQPPLQYYYYSDDTYWNKSSYVYNYGNVLWSVKDSTGALTNMTIETKGINCTKISNSQIDIQLGTMTSYLASIKVTGKRSNGQTITLNAMFRNNGAKPDKFKLEETPYEESFNNKPSKLIDTIFDKSSVNPDNTKYLDIYFSILDYNNHQFTDNYSVIFDLQQVVDNVSFEDLSISASSTNVIDTFPPIYTTQFFNSVTFKLKISSDGETWTEKDTGTLTLQDIARRDSITMSFANANSCRYIKLELSDVSFNTSYNPENIDMGIIELTGPLSITFDDFTYAIPQANIEVYEDFSKTSKVAEIDYRDLENLTDVGSQVFNTTSNELYIFNKTNDVLLNENNFKLTPVTNLDIYNFRNYTTTWSEPVIDDNTPYNDYIYTGCVCNYDAKVLNTNYNKLIVPIYKFTLQASEIKTPNNNNADEYTSNYNRFYFYYDSSHLNTLRPKILRQHLTEGKFDIINCAYGDVTSIALNPYEDDTKENTVTILLCKLDSISDNTANNILVWSDTNCNSILFDKTDIESGQVSFVLEINDGDVVPRTFRIVPRNLISTNLDKNFMCEKLTTEGNSMSSGIDITGIQSTSKTNIYRIKADTTYYFPDVGAILDQVSQSSIGNFSVELKFYTKEGVSDSTWTHIIYRNTSTPISRTYVKSPAHNSLLDENNDIVGDPYYLTITFSSNEAASALEDYFYISEEAAINRTVDDVEFKIENVETQGTTTKYKYTWNIPDYVLNNYISNVDYNIKFLPVNLGEKDNLTATGRNFIVKDSSSQYSMNLKYIPDTGISQYYEGGFTNTYNGKRIDGSRTWTQSTPSSIHSGNYSNYKFNLLQQVLYLENTDGHPGGTYEQIYCVQPNTWYVVCNAESVQFYNWLSRNPSMSKQLYIYDYEHGWSNGRLVTNYVSGATSLSGNTSKHPMLVYSGNNGYFMVVKTRGTWYNDSGIQVYYETNSGYNYKLNVWDIGSSSSDATRAIIVDKGIKHIGYVTNGQIWVHRNAWQGNYYTKPIEEYEEYNLNLTKNTSYSLLVIYKSSNSPRYVHLTKSYEYITMTTELRTGLPEYNSFRFISSLEDMYIKYPKLTTQLDDSNDYYNILNVFDNSNTSIVINSPYDDDINTYIETIRPGIYYHTYNRNETEWIRMSVELYDISSNILLDGYGAISIKNYNIPDNIISINLYFDSLTNPELSYTYEIPISNLPIEYDFSDKVSYLDSLCIGLNGEGSIGPYSFDYKLFTAEGVDLYNPDYTYKYYDVPKLIHKAQNYDNVQWRNVNIRDYHYVIGGNGPSDISSCQNIIIYNNNLNSYGLYIDLYDGYGNKVNEDPIEIPDTETHKYIKLSNYDVDIYEIDVQEQDSSGYINISYILYNDYVLDSLDVNVFDESDSTFIYNYDSSRKQLNYKFNTKIVPNTYSLSTKYYDLQFEWYKKLFINSLGKSFTIPYKNFVDLKLNKIDQKYISKKSKDDYSIELVGNIDPVPDIDVMNYDYVLVTNNSTSSFICSTKVACYVIEDNEPVLKTSLRVYPHNSFVTLDISNYDYIGFYNDTDSITQTLNYTLFKWYKFFADSNMDDIYEDSPDFIAGENYIKYKQYFDAYGVSDFSIQNGKESTYTIEYPKKRIQYEILPLSFYDNLFSILGVVNYKINYYIKNGLIKIGRLPNEVGDEIESIFILADFYTNISISKAYFDIYTYTEYGERIKFEFNRLNKGSYTLSYFETDEEIKCCYIELVIKDKNHITIENILTYIYILSETYQNHKCSVLRIPTSDNYIWYNEDTVDLNNYSEVISGNEMLIIPVVHSPIITDATSIVDILSSDDSLDWKPDNISDTITYNFNEDKIINTVQINVTKKSNYFIQIQYKNSEQENYSYLTDDEDNIITFDGFNENCLNIKTFNFNNIKANSIVITFTYENKYATDVTINEDKYYYIAFSDNSYNNLSFSNSPNSIYVDWGSIPGTFTSKLKTGAIWNSAKTFAIDGVTHKLYTNLIYDNCVDTVTYNSNSDSIIISFTRDIKEIIPLSDNVEIDRRESNESISGGGTKKTLLYSLIINNVDYMTQHNYYVLPISVIKYTDFEHSDNTNINKHYLYFNFTSAHSGSIAYDILPIYNALDTNWNSVSIYKNNNNLKCVDLNSSTTQFALVSADPSEIYGPDFSKEIYIIFENAVGKSWHQPSDTGIGYKFVYKFNYLDIDTNIFENISMIKAGGSTVVKIKLSQTKSKKLNSFKIKDDTGLMHNIVIYDRYGEGEEPSHISTLSPNINWNNIENNIVTSVNYVNEDIFKVHFTNTLINTYTIEVTNTLRTLQGESKYTLDILFDNSATITRTNKGIINEDGHRLSLVVDSDLNYKETSIQLEINGSIETIYVLNANSYAILSEAEQLVTNNPTNVYRYDISSINDTARVKVGNANIWFGNNGIGIWEKTTSDTTKNDYPLKYRFYLTNSNTHAVNSIQKAKTMYVELDNFTHKSGYNFSVSNSYWNSKTLQIAKLDKELMTYNVDNEYVFPHKDLLSTSVIKTLRYSGDVDFYKSLIGYASTLTAFYQDNSFEAVDDDILQLELRFLSSNILIDTEDVEHPVYSLLLDDVQINIVVNLYDSSDKDTLLFTETNVLSLVDVMPHTFSFSYIEMSKVKCVEILFTFSDYVLNKHLYSDTDIADYVYVKLAYTLYQNSTQQLNDSYIINHNTDSYDTMTNEDITDNITIVNESENNPDDNTLDTELYTISPNSPVTLNNSNYKYINSFDYSIVSEGNLYLELIYSNIYTKTFNITNKKLDYTRIDVCDRAILRLNSSNPAATASIEINYCNYTDNVKYRDFSGDIIHIMKDED